MRFPHLAWPIQLDTSGNGFLYVEQDSDEDVASCLATGVLWPVGTDNLQPTFGVRDQAFRNGGPDLQELREQLALSEPRARTSPMLDDARMPGFVANVTLGFNPALGSES